MALIHTGHVGIRVLVDALGSLDVPINVLGYQIGLVGIGALSIAIAVTTFYMLMLLLWHERFKKDYGWFGYLLYGAGVIRLIIILFPMNDWNSTLPPQPRSLIRNLPFMLLGLCVADLLLNDASIVGDRTFFWIVIMILVSYACYIPVILLVHQIPLIELLMIP